MVTCTLVPALFPRRSLEALWDGYCRTTPTQIVSLIHYQGKKAMVVLQSLFHPSHLLEIS